MTNSFQWISKALSKYLGQVHVVNLKLASILYFRLFLGSQSLNLPQQLLFHERHGTCQVEHTTEGMHLSFLIEGQIRLR